MCSQKQVAESKPKTMMSIIKRLKKLLKWTITDPNSPDGLRMRADRLVEKEGLSYQHPYVSALLKQADLKEDEERRKVSKRL